MYFNLRIEDPFHIQNAKLSHGFFDQFPPFLL
jgi:hypothetical protein